MEYTTDLATRLKTIRAALSLNQKDFAVKLGIKQQLLSKYENATLEIPDEIKFKLLHFGVNILWFFTGSGTIFTSNNVEDAQKINDLLQENADLRIIGNQQKDLITKLEKDNEYLKKSLETAHEALEFYRLKYKAPQ